MSILSSIRDTFIGSPQALFFASAPVSYQVENRLYNLPTYIQSVDIEGIRYWNVVMSEYVLHSDLAWWNKSIRKGALFNSKEEAYNALMEQLSQPKHTLYKSRGSEHLCLEE